MTFFSLPYHAPLVKFANLLAKPFPAADAEGCLLLSVLSDAISVHLGTPLAQAAAPEGSAIGTILNNPLLPLVGLFVLFYFIFIVPERRRKAEEAKMMSSLKKNDRIVTVGGIHGTVVAAAADSDVVTIKIDEAGNTRVKLNRSAVASIVRDGEGKAKQASASSKE